MRALQLCLPHFLLTTFAPPHFLSSTNWTGLAGGVQDWAPPAELHHNQRRPSRPTSPPLTQRRTFVSSCLHRSLVPTGERWGGGGGARRWEGQWRGGGGPCGSSSRKKIKKTADKNNFPAGSAVHIISAQRPITEPAAASGGAAGG